MSYIEFCRSRGIEPCEESLKRYNACVKLGIVKSR